MPYMSNEMMSFTVYQCWNYNMEIFGNFLKEFEPSLYETVTKCSLPSYPRAANEVLARKDLPMKAHGNGLSCKGICDFCEINQCGRTRHSESEDHYCQNCLQLNEEKDQDPN